MRSLEEIIQILKENEVTGYKICKDTKGAISENGANKILDGKSPNPRRITLELLNSYINDQQLDDIPKTSIFNINEVLKNEVSDDDLKTCIEVVLNNLERSQKVTIFKTYTNLIQNEIEVQVRREYTEMISKLIQSKEPSKLVSNE